MTTQRNLDFSPGTLCNYGSYGYVLLGQIIEVVTHFPYASYTQTAVVTSLGINRIVLGASEFESRRVSEVPYFVATDPSLQARFKWPCPPCPGLRRRQSSAAAA